MFKVVMTTGLERQRAGLDSWPGYLFCESGLLALSKPQFPYLEVDDTAHLKCALKFLAQFLVPFEQSINDNCSYCLGKESIGADDSAQSQAFNIEIPLTFLCLSLRNISYKSL